MKEYYKLVILGEGSLQETSLLNKNVSRIFEGDLKVTIGANFCVKAVNFEGSKVLLRIWDLQSEERFRVLLPAFIRGAHGAIFSFDITNRNTLNQISDWIKLVRENLGDVPIILVGNNLDLEESRTISYDEGLQISKDSKLSGFLEVSGKTGENIEDLFNLVVHSMIQVEALKLKYGLIKPEHIDDLEFKVNKYVELKLKGAKTNIYVGGKLFRQCKFLLLNISKESVREYDEINSIDEAAEELDSSMEEGRIKKHYLSPDTEFWGHCSNIQAWYESDYDTRLLHRNLAFPLLKALVEVGDSLAKKVFKEEIMLRLKSGYPSVVLHLINEDYLKYITKRELNVIFENPDFIRNLSKWPKLFKDVPKWLFEKIKTKLRVLKCQYCGIKISEALIQKLLSGRSIKCNYCYSEVV